MEVVSRAAVVYFSSYNVQHACVYRKTTTKKQKMKRREKRHPLLEKKYFTRKIISCSKEPYSFIAFYPIPIDCEARVPESGIRF